MVRDIGTEIPTNSMCTSSMREIDVKYRELQEYLRPLGIVMSKRGTTIRLNSFGGLENTARYSETLEGALAIAGDMAKPRRNILS
jgi:hypothetical protein